MSALIPSSRHHPPRTTARQLETPQRRSRPTPPHRNSLWPGVPACLVKRLQEHQARAALMLLAQRETPVSCAVALAPPETPQLNHLPSQPSQGVSGIPLSVSDGLDNLEQLLVHLYICIYVYILTDVYTSIHLSIHLSIYLPIYVCMCMYSAGTL